MERPILFSGDMVRAILRNENSKTQTRRVIKPQPDGITSLPTGGKTFELQEKLGGGYVTCGVRRCPYGSPRDRLWVREAFLPDPPRDGVWDWMGDFKLTDIPLMYWSNRHVIYRADPKWGDLPAMKWMPSIHMPRWASRLTLEIVNVRVERLQEISPQDACAEGIEQDVALVVYPETPERIYEACSKISVERYQTLWDSINEKRGYGWDKNPWVWVVEFKRITP